MSDNQVKSDSISSTTLPTQLPPARQFVKSWADIDEEKTIDLIEFPVLGSTLDDVKKLQEARIQEKKDLAELQSLKDKRRLNRLLSSRKTIKIIHHETSRELEVVSFNTFEHFMRTFKLFKSHRKDGSLDYREQQGKIKIANQLLRSCYKHPSEPLFIYAVAEISLGDDRSIKVDQVESKCGRPFTIVKLEHDPHASI